jgi:hypothetical protein
VRGRNLAQTQLEAEEKKKGKVGGIHGDDRPVVLQGVRSQAHNQHTVNGWHSSWSTSTMSCAHYWVCAWHVCLRSEIAVAYILLLQAHNQGMINS